MGAPHSSGQALGGKCSARRHLHFIDEPRFLLAACAVYPPRYRPHAEHVVGGRLERVGSDVACEPSIRVAFGTRGSRVQRLALWRVS